MKNSCILHNGITLVSHKLCNVHSITISISFRTGVLFETEEKAGISHLIEHLFFRQWYDLSMEQLYSQMQSIGGEIVGTTYYDYVSFELTVSNTYMTKAFDLISKCLNRFKFDENCIKLEKKIVLRQIENKISSYEEWQDSLYLKNTKYDYPIMGNIETINNLTSGEINEWKDNFFCCNNSCVIITGNYDEREFDYIKEKLSSIDNFGFAAKRVYSLPQDFGNRHKDLSCDIISIDGEMNSVTFFFDISDKIEYEKVRLISSILGEGCGSKLSFLLREQRGLVDDIFTKLSCFNGFYRLSISYDVKSEYLVESIEAFFETINNIKFEITEQDYSNCIVFFTENQLMDFDVPRDLNRNYVYCDFVLGNILSEPLAKKSRYEIITKNELKDCANLIFTFSNLSSIIQTDLEQSYIKKIISNIQF